MFTEDKLSSDSFKKPRLIYSIGNESGSALIMALLITVVMISLAPVAVHLSSNEMHQSRNFKESREAFFVAEAGLEHAKSLTEASSLRAVLAGPDDLISAISGDTADDDDNGTFGTGTAVLWPDGHLYNEVVLGGKNYYIRAYDNNDGNADYDIDNTIILRSVGINKGITTSIEAVVYNPPGVPVSAVTTNGDLEIQGDPNIAGDCGSAHSNSDLDVSGNPNIDENATATGNYSESGSPTVGGTSGGSMSHIEIPLLDPTRYEAYADYILAADGNVYDSSGSFVSSPPWNGWNYSNPEWRLTGNSTIDAFLYVDGDVKIMGSPGSPGTPWETTIIATGYIDVGGNPVFINKKNPSHPVDIQNLFMVAGTDIEFNGNSNQNIEGLIYATEQIQLNGNPNINGAVLAYDSASSESLVTQNLVSGNANITYGCGLTIPNSSGEIEVVSWNEL